MRTADVRFKKSLLCAAVLLCLTLAVSASAQVAGHAEYCELRLTGCPQDYDKKELTVPLNMVALSTRVKACGVVDTAQYLGGGPPSIMFVIDHSNSMSSDIAPSLDNPTPPKATNDPDGSRFKVTRALVDTISKVYPDAKIGIVVFGTGLVLNTEWDENLEPFNGYVYPTVNPDLGEKVTQSYLPLRSLNHTVRKVHSQSNSYVSGAGDNPTWLNIIQGMFNVPKSGKSTLRDGKGLEVKEENGTNISMAFEAALQAFEKAEKEYHLVNMPKQNRYIIFLSDGKPFVENRHVTNNQWHDHLYDFLKGKNTPATYTVFLSSAEEPIPYELYDTLDIMTENIRRNGYSISNPRSAINAMSADYGGLLKYMMDNIVTPMLSNSTGSAKTIVISSAGVKDSTGAMDGDFTFSRPLPMDTAEITNVNMGIRYDVQIDSTIKGYDGARDSVILRTVYDSLFTYSFTIRRSAATLGENWLSEQDLGKECGSKSSLDLRFNGASLVGKEIKGNMDVLQIVFDNEGGLFEYDSIIVQAFNADGEIADFETFALTKDADGKWSYQFPRKVVSSPAIQGDGTLQHSGQDSIILFFRNPEVPLDTIRITVPYLSNAIVFYDTPGDPANGNRLNSHLEWTAGAALDIYADIFDSDGNWDPVMTANIDKIVWTISTDTTALTNDGAHGVFRSETADSTLHTITATYTDGALKISGQITIKVVPGEAAYIETVSDSTEINRGRVSNIAYLAGNKEYTFKKGSDRAVFYAVLRDAYGNFISMADGSDWTSTNTNSITVEAIDAAASAAVSKHGSTFGNNLYVIVEKDGLSDTVHITVVSESFSAVSPNPFVPGNSFIMDRLEKLDAGRMFVQLYSPIVAHSKRGGGNGNAYNANGVLITATAPRPIRTQNGNSEVMYVKDAKAIIYDAVGRVVFRSESGDLVTPDGNTFGFVWDGKNTTGKTVGPGSYAVQITATMTNGEKFFVQRMIGVKLERY